MTIPAATLEPAVAVLLFPSVLMVEKLRIEVLAVHVVDLDGGTLKRVYVVAAHVYE